MPTILARSGPVLPDHLPPPMPAQDAAGTWDGMLRAMVRRWTEHQLDQSADVADLYEKLLKVIEPPLLQETLRRHHGQFAAAARQLGMHRVTLKKKIDENHREQ